MQAVPENVLKSFRGKIVEAQIDGKLTPHYLKWLRYYWDFCGKYRYVVESPASLDSFINKLESKGQGRALLVQAREAVALFYALGLKEDVAEVRVTSVPVVEVSRGRSVRAEWSRVLDELGAEIKLRQYSPKTLQTYLGWVRRFEEFLGGVAVETVSAEGAKAFLTWLAVERRVAASTQNQAFNALLFLFRHVLKKDYELGDTVTRAKTSTYIPTVLNREELGRIMEGLEFPYSLVVSVLYGCGLRLAECLNLRVNCLDFDQNLVIVHDGKGRKDRSVPMPRKIKGELRAQVERIEKLLDRDLETPNYGGVFLPQSIANKSKFTRVGREFQWQWIFPAKMLTLVPDEGCYRRYHNYDKNVSRAIRGATLKSKVAKRVTAHTFRHTFASHLLQGNVDLRTIQQLMGHSDIRTTMIYLHTVKSRTLKEMISPMDL